MEKTFGKFRIPKIKKLQECQLKRTTMNITITEACTQASDAEKGKIEIRPAIPFVPETTVETDRTDKNKDEFISVTCRYRPSAKDSKINNYTIQAKRFETGTTEDILRWYIALQEIFEKKPCEDAESKFGVVELLLGGQGRKDFMRIKKTVTEGLVASDSTTSVATPRGITEESFKMTLENFKNQAFKDFAARHQVNYLRQNLRKPVGVTARACAGRLQEISNYLEYFPGPDSNVPLTEGDIINILTQMVPATWRRSMISINFQPFNKTMTKVIEYMEKLEVLEATNKQSTTKKQGKEKSEDKTDKSRNKTKKSHKGHKSKGRKRKRNDSDSEDDRYNKYCAVCKAKGGPFWTHNTDDCRVLAGFRKKKQKAISGLNKKEFNALVHAQVKRVLEGKNKKEDDKISKNDSSVTSIDLSDMEE